MARRTIPSGPVEPAPDLVHAARLRTSDRSILSNLSRRLREDGVVGEEKETSIGRPEVDLRHLMDEAVAASQTEEQFSPSTYQPEVDEIISERQRSRRDWDNPDLPSSMGGSGAYSDDIESAPRIAKPRIGRDGKKV